MGKHHKSGKDYTVASEIMTLEDKESFLKEIGQEELISLFNSWTPKAYNMNKKNSTSSVPLDQKMSLTVTKEDRLLFESDLASIRDDGEDVSMSQLVRNKALATPDIHEWKIRAVNSLKEIGHTVNNKKKVVKRINDLSVMIDAEKDDDIVTLYLEEQKKLKSKMGKLKSITSKRTQRLSGRVTFQESELIRWRAARLCLSTSDYLRMMIFDLFPDSEADQHMSLISRQRFYIAIGDIAKNGWGEPPTMNECSHCNTMSDKIEKLELENSQLRGIL